MIRRLMASSALTALLAAGAFSLAHAQTEQPAADQPTATEPAAGADGGAAPADEGEQLETQPAQPTLTPQEPTIATAFMGKAVYSSQDPQSDNIGEVNDLIIGPDGKITHAVVGVGGFLGIGEKNVAVPFDQLQVAQNEGGEIRLIYAATREQLETAPAYDATAFDPEERADQEQSAAGGEGSGAGAGTAGAGGVTPGLTPTPADTPAAGADTGAGNTDPNDVAAGAETGAPDPAGEDAAGDATAVQQPVPADATDAPADAVVAPTGDAATAPAPAGDAAAGSNTTVVEQQPVPANQTDAPADAVVAPTGDAATAPADAAQPAEAPATPPPGAFMSFDPNQMRASSMIGQELYGPNNESIGEVSDLIVQDDGKTRAALIDVGGFLGIGEKRVSIPFDQITMAPPAPPSADMTAAPDAGTDPAAGGGGAAGAGGTATLDPAAGGTAGGSGAAGGDQAAEPGPAAQTAEPVMTVAMTREQIEQLPEWQDPNAQAAAGGEGGGSQEGGQNAALSPPIVAPDPNAPAGGATTGAGTDPNAAGGGQQQAAGDAQTQFQPVTREMSADDLMGSAVYSQNEENLGDVGDVIFDAQGAVQAVVVDVGGFLGIGEKPVALQYSAVDVQQNGNGDIRIMVDATQEQLENAPSYAETAAAAQGQGAQPAVQPAPQ